MQYSNPRLDAIIDNWPYGQRRTTATFHIETHPRRGERGTRTTIHPKTGRLSKPKVLTYALQVRVVDGDDGRTYLLERTPYHLTVMQSNMQFVQEVISSQDARFEELMGMFA